MNALVIKVTCMLLVFGIMFEMKKMGDYHVSQEKFYY